MTEPVPTPTPSDPTVDELSTQTAKTMAEISRGVLSAEGVRWLKAQIVTSTSEAGRRFVQIRRETGGAVDAKTYPVLSVGKEPLVGQWVHALDTPGGLVILGMEQLVGGLTLEGTFDLALSANALAGSAYSYAGQAYSLASSAYSLASSAYSYADTAYKTGVAAQQRADAAYGFAGAAYGLAGHAHPYAAAAHGHGSHAHSYGYYYAAGLGLVWTPASTGAASV